MSRPDGRNSKPRRPSQAYLKLVHDTTPRLVPNATSESDARHRVVIVPLDEPATTPAAPAEVPRLAPTVQPSDRRQSWPGRDASGDAGTRLVCPSCAVPARVDVVDLRNKRLHLSCDRCFRMWQDRVRVEDKMPAGLQRMR